MTVDGVSTWRCESWILPQTIGEYVRYQTSMCQLDAAAVAARSPVLVRADVRLCPCALP